nr:defensin-like protein 1 [Ipomoea batatas]
MALTKLNKVAFVALLVCFILIASYETQMVEAKKCMKHMSWGGRCPPMRCTNWCKGMGGYKCMKMESRKRSGAVNGYAMMRQPASDEVENSDES